MIKLELDENNAHVLRITASYFLALAGDIDVEIKERRVISDAKAATLAHDKLVEPGPLSHTGNYAPAAGGAILPVDEFVDPASVFGEFETAGKLSDDPSPAAVFAGKSPDVAPSIAAVEAFATAPVDTTATTLTPPPTAAPLPHAVPPESTVAPVAPHTANHAGGVEIDARGLPWDARIHSRERTKIANGQWKNKRGTDPELIKTVEAELAGVMSSAPASAPVVTPPPVIVAPPPSPATSANVASPSNVTPPPAPSNVTLDFPAIMRKITTAVTGKIMTATQAAELAQRYGVTSPALLINRPDLFPAIDAELDIIIAAGPQS